MSIYTPYTYLIGWSTENKWYYGVRYAKKHLCLYDTGCHPDEFWVTYFTSSETVKDFLKEFGEPDVIQIRKTFLNEDSAVKWERKVLSRMDVIHSNKWLNKSSGCAIRTSSASNKGKLFWNNGIETIRAYECPGEGWKRGIFLTEEQKKQRSEGKIGEKNSFFNKKHNEENKQNQSKKMTGENNPFYGKKRPEHSEKMKISMKGREITEEHRNNISKSHNKVYVCPHCDKSGGRMMLRWHFDKCKHNPENLLAPNNLS
jgi:hypothetical protein